MGVDLSLLFTLLVVRPATQLAKDIVLKDGWADRLGLLMTCFQHVNPARRGSCIIADGKFIANYHIENYRIPDIEKLAILLGIPVSAPSPIKRKLNI